MEELYSEYCRNKLKSDSLVQRYADFFFKVCFILAISTFSTFSESKGSVSLLFLRLDSFDRTTGRCISEFKATLLNKNVVTKHSSLRWC